MKKCLKLILIAVSLTAVTGCSKTQETKDVDGGSERQTDMQQDTPLTIDISIGEDKFTAALEDNKTADEFVRRLPLSVVMDDMNRNEKYCYLSESLRQDEEEQPGTVRTGDIMCYSDNCLVLFYETFDTSYSYVPLGHVEDSEGFANALGEGSVELTFKISRQE